MQNRVGTLVKYLTENIVRNLNFSFRYCIIKDVCRNIGDDYDKR